MKIRRLLVAAGLVGAGLGGAVLAAAFSGALSRAGLRPGWEWLLVKRPHILTAAFVLLPVGLILAAGALGRTRSPRLARVLGGLGLVALAGAVVFPPGGWRSSARARIPVKVVQLGDERVLLLFAGRSPEAIVLTDGDVSRRDDLLCDEPLEFRPSKRPGRLLVTGDGGTVGALVDERAGTVTVDPALLPPLEALKAEFGPGIMLKRP